MILVLDLKPVLMQAMRYGSQVAWFFDERKYETPESLSIQNAYQSFMQQFNEDPEAKRLISQAFTLGWDLQRS